MVIFPSGKLQQYWLFFLPIVIFGCFLVSLLLEFGFQQRLLAQILCYTAIALGSFRLLKESIQALWQKNFALDYIALLAITTGVVTGNYYVAVVIVLMMVGGNTLEDYAQKKAAQSLTALKNYLPQDVQVVIGEQTLTKKMDQVEIGSTLLIRKGEVVALDGILVSKTGTFDESSFTGEAFPVDKAVGEKILSGTINLGGPVLIKTTVNNKDSNYQRILDLVEEAQAGKAPFLQLADKLSIFFTLFTLFLAVFAYWLSHDLERVLAVLVIATPCPLILATPIAIIGGVNQAAKHLIIFRRLAALEILARVKAIIFDKTGTITFGEIRLAGITIVDKSFSRKKVMQLARSLASNSLHPLAKSLLRCCQDKKLVAVPMTNIQEKTGSGMSGYYQGKRYAFIKSRHHGSRNILTENRRVIAYFDFTDEIKPKSQSVIRTLQQLGIKLYLFTGDKQQRAEQLLRQLPSGIELHAHCSPEDKRLGIQKIMQDSTLTAMVGDGINDAPALALANVGLAFSHQENSAASEAADVVILNNNFEAVQQAVQIARRSLHIAKESMYIGLGLSMIGMLFAAFGSLQPLFGAITQELIDVAVILNALRTSKEAKKSY